jgi:phosphatidylethanolamine/phosphatidyl-N-methylethanolamine N-methyltransferase
MKETDIKRAYARWASSYDFTFGKIADAGRIAAVKHINRQQGSVLEVGVGTGISLPHYGNHLQISGIDLSPEMLALAKQKVKQRNLKQVSTITEMDAGNMSFADNSFDTVVAMYVMTVVPDPVKVMRELARVCKPGGEVIIVNHFSQSNGLRGAMEKLLARFGNKLGWRPEFPIETVLVCDDLQVIDAMILKPFGLFTLLRFKKQLQEAENTATDDAAKQPENAVLRIV